MTNSTKVSAVIISVSIGKKRAAKQLAYTLLEKKLIACANMITGVRSMYRWKGKILKSKEVMLLCKTSKAKSKKVTQMIQKLHPAERPVIEEITVQSLNSEAMAWLSESLK